MPASFEIHKRFHFIPPRHSFPSVSVRQNMVWLRSNKQPESQGTLPFLGSNFMNLAYHASIVVDNTLYIDGGEIDWQVQGQPQGIVPQNQTLAIDLSQSWAPSSVAVQSFSKDGPPVLNFGTLWAGSDDKSFYAFGGDPSRFKAYPPIPPPSFWQFSNGTWQSVIEGNNAFPSITRPVCGLAASGNGVGYMLGGFDSLDPLEQGYLPLPGIVSYNATSGVWKNESALGFSYDGTAFTGAMHFLPGFGSDGVLIAMGGEISNRFHWNDEGMDLLSFSNVSVYDPSKSSWYWQSTIGYSGPEDIPGIRIQVNMTSD